MPQRRIKSWTGSRARARCWCGHTSLPNWDIHSFYTYRAVARLVLSVSGLDLSRPWCSTWMLFMRTIARDFRRARLINSSAPPDVRQSFSSHLQAFPGWFTFTHIQRFHWFQFDLIDFRGNRKSQFRVQTHRCIESMVMMMGWKSLCCASMAKRHPTE